MMVAVLDGINRGTSIVDRLFVLVRQECLQMWKRILAQEYVREGCKPDNGQSPPGR